MMALQREAITRLCTPHSLGPSKRPPRSQRPQPVLEGRIGHCWAVVRSVCGRPPKSSIWKEAGHWETASSSYVHVSA
jgi:hypothetical protein